MDPIVHGITRQYTSCLNLERVNFHLRSAWIDRIGPLAAPEFALVNAEGKLLYRWSGYTDAATFDGVLEPLCRG